MVSAKLLPPASFNSESTSMTPPHGSARTPAFPSSYDPTPRSCCGPLAPLVMRLVRRNDAGHTHSAQKGIFKNSDPNPREATQHLNEAKVLDREAFKLEEGPVQVPPVAASTRHCTTAWSPPPQLSRRVPQEEKRTLVTRPECARPAPPPELPSCAPGAGLG